MYSEYCDFYGHDIGREPSKAEDCGDICVSKPDCNHFTYQKTDSYCYLKSGKDIPAQSSETSLCGWVKQRKGDGNNNENGNKIGIISVINYWYYVGFVFSLLITSY